MLHKTRGIVFKTTDYSESSVIVQVFTEKFGMQSYMVNGAKKPKAKGQSASRQVWSRHYYITSPRALEGPESRPLLRLAPLIPCLPR